MSADYSQFHNMTVMAPSIVPKPAPQPPAGSLQYVFTKNYTTEKAKPRPGEASNAQYLAPKKFAKGDIVWAIKVPDGPAGRIITVIDGGYDITDAVIEWKIGANEVPAPGKESSFKKWITPTNVLLAGVLVVGVVLLIKRA